MNVVEILRFGVIGLSFLLAFMAYRLLSQVLREEAVKPSRYWAVGMYMAFSLVLCAIGLFAQLGTPSSTPSEVGGAPAQPDKLAPTLRLALTRTDVPQPKCVGKGINALERSGFTGNDYNTNSAWGYDREHLGVVWCPDGEQVAVFVVGGDDWDTVDTKVTNLKRDF